MRAFPILLGGLLMGIVTPLACAQVVSGEPSARALNRLQLPPAPPAVESRVVSPRSQTEYLASPVRMPRGKFEESILARRDVWDYYLYAWPPIFGRPYYNPVEQPTGRVVRQLGPNRWESAPVYGANRDRTEPLWKISRREEVTLPGQGQAPLAPERPERDPLARAVTDFRAGRYAEADRWLAESTGAPRGHAPAELLGVQTALALGHYAEAAAHLSRAMSQLPADRWGLVVANYRDYYGRQLDLADHLRTLEAELKRNAATADALNVLGFEYALLGYPTDARKRWERVLLLDPDNALAQRLLREFRSSSRREF